MIRLNLFCLIWLCIPFYLNSQDGKGRPENLPDLDVTFISRTPRYERLNVTYDKRKDGFIGDVNPHLTEAEQKKKRWPLEGEKVKFIAHVRNQGDIAVISFEYIWQIDGRNIKKGISGKILPGEEMTFELEWNWKNGEHSVSFTADPQHSISEISYRNNSLTDRIDALTFHFHVEKSVHEYFKTIRNSIGTYSWEDWAQSQVSLMNNLFKSAVYPLTPNGIIERVRIDQITIHSDNTLPEEGAHAPEDSLWDGRWGFTCGYLKDKYYEKFPQSIRNEWSLIHELAHQIGRIDLYCLDVTEKQNEVNHTKMISKYVDCLMHRGIYIPENEVHFFCEHTAYSLNRDKGTRRGHFGEYLLDVPADNYIRILDENNSPLSGVHVKIYQAVPYGYTEKKIPKDPKFSGKSDKDGLFRLGKNPFGEINNWGTNGIFLVEVSLDNKNQFQWLEIPDFNLEYWRGNKQKAVFNILVDRSGLK